MAVKQRKPKIAAPCGVTVKVKNLKAHMGKCTRIECLKQRRHEQSLAEAALAQAKAERAALVPPVRRRTRMRTTSDKFNF